MQGVYINNEIRKKVEEKFLQGCSVKSIAKCFDISEGSVYRILKSYGIRVRMVPGKDPHGLYAQKNQENESFYPSIKQKDIDNILNLKKGNKIFTENGVCLIYKVYPFFITVIDKNGRRINFTKGELLTVFMKKYISVNENS